MTGKIENRIIELMETNNLSSARFAEALGISQAAVSHIISGRNKPSLDMIEKILKAFPDVDANWLVSGTTKPTATTNDKETSGKDLFTEHPAKVKQEETVDYGKKTVNSINKPAATGKVVKIILVYDDNTYSELSPR